LDGLYDDLDVLGGFVQAIGILQNQIGVAGYDVEDVVDIVGNSAGQRADAFHLLNLEKLLLQLFPFADRVR
jgi:hypothetical protein